MTKLTEKQIEVAKTIGKEKAGNSFGLGAYHRIYFDVSAELIKIHPTWPNYSKSAHFFLNLNTNKFDGEYIYAEDIAHLKNIFIKKINDKIEAEESTVEVEPIRERYVKDLADLKAIYEASQAEDPKRTIYPIFRINPYTAGKSIFFCLRNDIPDPDGQDCYGYMFYTPEESSAYGDFEYFIPTLGNPDLEGEIEPDDLIYTGQNFWEAKHKIDSELEDFTVSIDGKELEYQVFQAGAFYLNESDQIVLGAWYFHPEDPDAFPFSNGYKTKEAAIAAANDYELEEAERRDREKTA